MIQEQALAILRTGTNIFLTGEPGSGKTYTLNSYVSYLRAHEVHVAITASTGIAATHIGGMTIHSWSGIGIKDVFSSSDIAYIANSKGVAKRAGKASVLIIDEISMLDGKTFSVVDAVCRKARGINCPFGGLQVVCVGDFFQLPPVARAPMVGQFAFESDAWRALKFKVCYLSEQYRQDDHQLLGLLAAIRSNKLVGAHIDYLRSRVVPEVGAPDGVTKLFTHNVDVDRVNSAALARIACKAASFHMTSHGQRALVDKLKAGCLSPEMLELKIGAVVMFTRNNPLADFVNGTMGEVIGFNRESGYPLVRTRDGVLVHAEPMEWIIEESGVTRARIIQIPLRLAWAITVHKSQGMSLDAALMDLGNVFEFGQGYVALSRVRRSAGLYLLGWNNQALRVHPSALAVDESFRAQSEDAIRELATASPAEIKSACDDFIIRSCGKLENSVVAPPQFRAMISTLDATLALIKEGKTIEDVARARGMTEGTIVSHVEDLVLKNRLSRAELMPLINTALVSALPVIHAVFREATNHKLKPVFEKFGGKYSYNDLRLARLMLE